MPRVSSDHLESRRRQILDAARTAFARYGFEGATVRVLEEQAGLSRGAIFHHYADKDALFLALADADVAAMADTVAAQGLVQVMRDLIANPDAGRLGTQLEITRRLRTDAGFRAMWAERSSVVGDATRARLRRQLDAGVLRTDVDIEVLASYLELVLEGLVTHLAAGLPADHFSAVLDLVESSVRK
ncbi:MAG: TetR/AcrR family transcriptional regulator [Nakamurella sp.]